MASIAAAQKEERIVFTAGTKSFSVRDVLDAAHFRGEIETAWEELCAREAAARKADEAELEMDDSAVDAAAVEFRYRYDLITAEETEAWLEMRGLNLAEFSAYFAREYWGKTFRQKADFSGPPFHQATAEMREHLVIELALNGLLDLMATQLSWRVAAACAAGLEVSTEPRLMERQSFLERSGLEDGAISRWLKSLGRDELWLDEMITLDGAFRREREKILTADASERELAALRLPLTRFDVETVAFESHDAASEAVLCVRDDGMTMAEVADEGRYPYRRTELVFENIPDELQQKYLSLTPGDLLEPIPLDDGFQLSRLLGKIEPQADDPRVRARIEERILERHFAELVSKQIRWEIIPASME